MARRTPAAIQALRADAARLRKLGTKGDTVLAHINPAEARLLDFLADRKIDYPTNRETGLPAFGMSDGESGRAGGDANPGGVGGGPAGGNTGGGIGGNTAEGTGGLGGGYGGDGYDGSRQQQAAEQLGDYYQDTYINGMVDTPYAPKDTWERVWQEVWNPSIPHDKYGPPTGAAPNAVRTAVGMLAPGMMGGLMGLGAALGRAQSPEEQKASMAHNQALGAQNSTGIDPPGQAPRQQLAEWIADSNQPSDQALLGRVQPPGPAPTISSLAGDNLLTKLLLRPGPQGALVGLLGFPR